MYARASTRTAPAQKANEKEENFCSAVELCKYLRALFTLAHQKLYIFFHEHIIIYVPRGKSLLLGEAKTKQRFQRYDI